MQKIMLEKEDYYKLQVLIELDRKIEENLKSKEQNNDFFPETKIIFQTLKDLIRKYEDNIINNNLKNEKR